MAEFFYEYSSIFHPEYTLILENDGCVAYAYLLESGKIVGDVWLYNEMETPAQANWTNQKQMPFLNFLEYTRNEMALISTDDEAETEVDWEIRNGTISVRCKMKSGIEFILQPDSKPGWSNHVFRDSPIAKVLAPI